MKSINLKDMYLNLIFSIALDQCSFMSFKYQEMHIISFASIIIFQPQIMLKIIESHCNLKETMSHMFNRASYHNQAKLLILLNNYLELKSDAELRQQCNFHLVHPFSQVIFNVLLLYVLEKTKTRHIVNQNQVYLYFVFEHVFFLIYPKVHFTKLRTKSYKA